MHGKKSKRHAFSMMEILVVLGIMSLLSAALIPIAGRNLTESQNTRAKIDMSDIENAIKKLYVDTGWPPILGQNKRIYSRGDKEAFLNTGYIENCGAEGYLSSHLYCQQRAYRHWKGPYIDEPSITDPWDSPYLLRAEGYCPSSNAKKYVWLLSSGEDQAINTDETHRLVQEDDIGVRLYINETGKCLGIE